MITSSKLGLTKVFRAATALFSTSFALVLLTVTAQAQGNEELFRGTWQVDTPDRGALILIVKNQGLASYFWGDNTDRTVYQGNWSSEDNAAILTWADGSRHRIKRDDLGFGMTYFDSNGIERYTAQAEQVPTEILGQWAKPPTREEAALSDRDQAKGFFGIWEIGESDGSQDYVFVEPDRSAASTEGGDDGLRGSWAKQGSELHISWDSGHYSILRESRRAFAYKRIDPGEIIEDDESTMRPAVRTIEENVSSTWLADYREEREVHSGGIAFSNRKEARDFYRGAWIVKYSADRFERIEIGRFGGLSTSARRDLGGDWRMQGQDIFMRWDDGIRKILSPVGDGFVLYEYRPARPLDGVPTRIRAAAPADNSKLEQHLKGRRGVAQQMVKMAEASGIDPSQQNNTGWGRTFARWVWPFSENEAPASSQELLAEEYEGSAETDPWWWPFWSEKPAGTTSGDAPKDETDAASPEEMPTSEAAAGEAEPENSDVKAPAPTAETANPSDGADEAPKTEKKGSSTRDWDWPF